TQAGRVPGSIARGQFMVPAQLERTAAKDFADTGVLNKEQLVKLKGDPLLFVVAQQMFHEASAKKADAAQVREWLAIVNSAAEAYGPRWQGEAALRAAEALADAAGLAPLAEASAREALRLLGPKPPTLTEGRVLTALATALKKQDKAEYR